MTAKIVKGLDSRQNSGAANSEAAHAGQKDIDENHAAEEAQFERQMAAARERMDKWKDVLSALARS